MRAFRRLAAAALVYLAVGGAAADKLTASESKARALLTVVAEATSTQDGDKGAKALAELAVLAVAEKSLSIEERATDALEDLVDALDVRPPEPGTTVTKAGPREVLAIVMKALDPARHGVFLSAHAMAAELVLRAGEQGDAAHLDAARTTLTAYAATPKCGKAAAAVLALADALHAARGGSKDASARLTTAAGLLNAGAWLRPSLVCAFERLVLHAGAGEFAEAGKSVAEIGARVHETTSPLLVRSWRWSVHRRILALPESVRASVLQQLVAYREGAPAAAGRDGDAGVDANTQSPLGKAWQRLAPPKNLLAAKRLPNAFQIELGFGKDPKAEFSIEDGQKHWAKDGVHVAFGDGAVALLMLDHVGNRGQQGERSRPSAARAWYWLAPGETYVATKAGVLVTGP